MSDTTAYRVHAAVVPQDAPPGLWVDTAAKLLSVAAGEIDQLLEWHKNVTELAQEYKEETRLLSIEIDRLKAERLVLDQRIHNQRKALRENWMITEMRAEARRAWYPSKLLMSLLRRART